MHRSGCINPGGKLFPRYRRSSPNRRSRQHFHCQIVSGVARGLGHGFDRNVRTKAVRASPTADTVVWKMNSRISIIRYSSLRKIRTAPGLTRLRSSSFMLATLFLRKSSCKQAFSHILCITSPEWRVQGNLHNNFLPIEQGSRSPVAFELYSGDRVFVASILLLFQRNREGGS